MPDTKNRTTQNPGGGKDPVTTPIWRGIILCILISSTALAGGNENEPETTALEERLEAQEARIQELEKLLGEQMALLLDLRRDLERSRSTPTELSRGETTSPKIAAPAEQVASEATSGWSSSHAFVNSEDGRNSIQLRGRIHVDYRGYTGEEKPAPTFLMRRIYFGAQGNLGENYSYVLTADVAETGGTLLRDAYLNARFSDAFQLRAGQFKAPFSQESIQSDNRITFVERHSLTNLAPGRTPGMMLHGSFRNDAVAYYLEAYNGRGILGLNDTDTPEVGGRLRFKPFQGIEGLRNFAFGGAVSQGQHAEGFSFEGRTASRSVTFFDRVPVRGKVTRANAEFEWVQPQFSLRGEFIQTNQARDGLGTGGGNLPGVVAKGYSLETSYLFGGDTEADGSVVPHTTFLENRGTGALQLALRYENLQVHDSANPNRGDAFTIGFNWQMSRFVRHMSNFAFERFQHPDRNSSFNGNDTFTYVGRMQLMF